MSISSVLKKLSAPVTNVRWSWGSVREADGVVFLSVWQDCKFVENGTPVLMVTHHAKYAANPTDLGYRERLKHLQLVQTGATCYLIMCKAKDPAAIPRETESLIDKELFLGGEIREQDGEIWIKVAKRVPIRDVMLKLAPQS